MIWRVIKKVLAMCRVQADFREGDTVVVKITFLGNVVLDKEFDIIPGS